MATREQLIQDDIKRLHAMGYAQELYRAMGGFSNFAISFTIISVLSGCLTSFSLGMVCRRAGAASLGWPIVSVFTLFVASPWPNWPRPSRQPAASTIWASKLGGPGWGWYHRLDQPDRPGRRHGGHRLWPGHLREYPDEPVVGHAADPGAIMITYAVCLALHAAMNILGVRLVALLNDVSVWWHIAVVALIVAFLAVKAPVHSFSTAFHTGFTNSGFPYWYSFLLGFLLAQYTITGFDASAHMSEETIGAETRAPWGIVMSVVISAFAGYALLMALVSRSPVPGAKDRALGRPRTATRWA